MAVSLKISKISEESYSFAGGSYTDFKEDNLFFKLGVNFDHNLDNEIFTVRLSVEYFYNHEPSSDPDELVSFKIAVTFKVTEMASVFNHANGGITLPDELLYAMVGTAIGTSRGMLLYKLAGTALSNYYIPIVSPKEILKNNKQ